MAEISKHKRVNNGLLNRLEVPCLLWMARHTPAWFNSDMYTGLGVFGAVVIFFGYWLCRFHVAFLWMASLGFVIHWVGDSMDGTLARYRNRQRPIYGFFIDHTTDTFAMILVFMGIGLSPYAKLSTALLALVGYLCMSILVYLRTCLVGVFEISFGEIGPTEMRLVAIIINTCLFFFGNPHVHLGEGIGRVTLLDITGYVISILLIATFAVATIKYGIVYARQDSLKLKDKGTSKPAALKSKGGR
jgi:archaetidylinositol phosphate synthase